MRALLILTSPTFAIGAPGGTSKPLQPAGHDGASLPIWPGFGISRGLTFDIERARIARALASLEQLTAGDGFAGSEEDDAVCPHCQKTRAHGHVATCARYRFAEIASILRGRS